MGLSKSKPGPRKGEEQMKAPSHSAPKPMDKQLEKAPQDSKQAGREAEKPADSAHLRAGAGKHTRPSSSEEKRDVKQKLNKKKSAIPQIIITQASNEGLISYSPTGNEDQRTIREQAEWGPYYRHRNPSTIIAYDVHTTE